MDFSTLKAPHWFYLCILILMITIISMMAFLDYKFHYDGSQFGFSNSKDETLEIQALRLKIDAQSKEIERLKSANLPQPPSSKSNQVDDSPLKVPDSKKSNDIEPKNLIDLIAGVWKSGNQEMLVEFNGKVGTLIKGGDKNRPTGIDFIHITETDGMNFKGRQRFKNGHFTNVNGNYFDGVLFFQSGQFSWSFTRN